MMRVRLSGVASLVVLVALAATGTAAPVTPPRSASVAVHGGETILTFPAASAATAPGSTAGDLGALVALPRDATGARAVLLDGTAGAVEVVADLMSLRGRPVALVRVSDPGDRELVVAVRYDGTWGGKGAERLASPTLDASLPGAGGPAGLKVADLPAGGSYVIVSSPQYAGALAPLVSWKTRKGWPVVLVTTDETGTTNQGIKDWLLEAYQTWDLPPEYVLLVGDVDGIPAWSFSGNVTDLPYALLDGDDWLPDLMIGRFSVSNQSECAAMVAKTVAYESTPYVDQTAWFTRGVMVAGQYASSTPMHTVRFCGEQLVSIGFDPLDPVTPAPGDRGNYIVSPFIAQEGIGVPQNMGPAVIKAEIDAGCSFVVYRGWAYGSSGWEPPHYTVDEIPSLANGAMTPVVMSFVCLNGDFSAADACFGEVFTRTGGSTPETFKGAVAFIGNGEHWSHTRFNDAMAISVFERAVDLDITTLGGLLNAGKLRFLEYFPDELDDTGDEESVEFYFHIYNLLGDPELNFSRAAPTALLATHPASLPSGTTAIEVAVTEADGTTPVAGARVGVAQAGVLLGRALTGAGGTARVVLSTAVGDGPVDITASRSDRIPYRIQINGQTSGVFVGLEDLGLGEASIVPGAVLDLLPTLHNHGTAASGSATVTFAVDGPATVTAGTALLDGLAAGASGTPQSAFGMTIDAGAEDGNLLDGELMVARGGEIDRSGFTLTVAAPDLQLTAVTATGDAWLEPGTTSLLTVTVVNAGSRDTAGGDLALALAPLDGATLLTSAVSFGAVPAGGSVTCGPVSVTLADPVAGGQTLILQATATCQEGAVQARALALPIGRGDVGEPAGPDAHGYFAYDSADYLYPGQRPVYRWLELSTEFGGPGAKLPFISDNYDTDVTLDLPFTFRFYGQDFDRIRVSDNGWLSFDDTDDAYNYYNWPLPSAQGNGAIVAPFWDNLNPEPVADPESDPVGLSSDGVYWYHDAAAGELIVEWSRMRHLKPEIADLQTFQAVLRDPAQHGTPSGDGEILFFYKQVADNDESRMYASVGIESPDETDGLQLTYDGLRSRGTLVFGPGQAVCLTTAPPTRVPLDVALTRQSAGDGAVLAWRLDDRRPVLGWRVHALADGVKTCLTPEALPADARAFTVADGAQDLVLEALLPYGASCDVGKSLAGAPDLRFALRAPVPNPLRGEASIAFALPRAGQVRLRVFDVRGRLVRTLLDGAADGGEGMVVWRGRDDRGRDLADGVYFCRLEHGGRTLTQKLLLVR
ncbi:MAG: C25 family cysteine peptidase [Candidatus Krumholzibacteriia bacterium]